MRAPLLFQTLHALRDEDYHAAGLWGNPAYSELHRGEDINISIPREALEQKVQTSIGHFFDAATPDVQPKHLYLFSRDGGAGKSHTQRRIREQCRQDNLPFVEMWHEDWHEGDVPQNLPYLMHVMEAEKVIVLLECDHPSELYEQLCQVVGAYIIGSGHHPSEELSKVRDQFEVLDLDKDYALTEAQIFALLQQVKQHIQMDQKEIVSEAVLRAISEHTRSPGRALSVLGVCLAIYVERAKRGIAYEITVDDARQWSYRNMPLD